MSWILILNCRKVRILDIDMENLGIYVYWISILNCSKVRVLDIYIEF